MSRRQARDDQGGAQAGGLNNNSDNNAPSRFKPLSLVASSVPRQQRARVATVQRQLSQALRPVPVVTNASFDIYGNIATRLLGKNYYHGDNDDRGGDRCRCGDDDANVTAGVSLATTTAPGNEIKASLLQSDLPPRDLSSERALWDGVKPSWSSDLRTDEAQAGVHQSHHQPSAGAEMATRPTIPLLMRCSSCLTVNVTSSVSDLTESKSSRVWPPEGLEQTIRARADDAAECHCHQLKLAGSAAKTRLIHGDETLFNIASPHHPGTTDDDSGAQPTRAEVSLITCCNCDQQLS